MFCNELSQKKHDLEAEVSKRTNVSLFINVAKGFKGEREAERNESSSFFFFFEEKFD